MVDFIDMIPYWERYADRHPPPKERHPFTGSYDTVPVDPVDADVLVDAVPVLTQDAPTLVSDNCVEGKQVFHISATLLEQIVHKQFELLSQRFEQRFDRLEQQIKEIQQDNAQQFELLEQKSEIVDQTLDALHLKCAILRSPLASPSDPAPPSISPVILNADPPVVALPDPALDQVALLASTAVPAPCWIPIRLSTSGPPFLRPRSRRHLPRPSRRIRRGPRRSIPRGPRRPIRRGPAPALEPPRLCVLFGPSIRRYHSSRTRGTNTSRPRLLRPFEHLKGQEGRSTTSRSATLFGLKRGVRMIPE